MSDRESNRPSTQAGITSRSRELVVLAMVVCVVVFVFVRKPNLLTVAGFPAFADEPPSDLIVWSGDKPTGQTWANLGAKGKIELTPNAGLDGTGKALTIHMAAEGYRGCGLNWKGWYPADACDDVSKYAALVFHVRQVTAVDNVDLTVSLVDNLKRNGGEQASNVLHVIGDGGIKRINGEWQKVVIPLSKFANNKPLRLDRLWEINFGHYGSAPVTVQIDRIGFTQDAAALERFPDRPDYQATTTLDLSKPGHRISDGIYGVCGLPENKLREYGITITRWGGNTSSRYNWKNNADNGASDWFFKNRGPAIRDLTETGYLKHIHGAQERGATTYQTVPMLGWVAKDNSSYGFSVKKYGEQKQTEPGHHDIGNGIHTNGKPVRNNDPRDTSIEVGPDFVGEAVEFLVNNAGPASGVSKSGVKYWVLDNEPMIWHETHRDVRPDPLGYDELWERTIKYAEAIKKADPTAKVAGFCSWGWTDLFYSAKDEGGDRYSTTPDHRDHGRVPLAEWFIRKCGEYKKQHGKSLVDVFDFHWYPQAQANGKTPFMGKGMDASLCDLRLRSVRDLWDSEYVQESWIRNSGDRQPTQVIRRVRQWVDQHNPGMEICLGEYNFGGSDNVSGGLAQADVFGVLAREKVDLAFIWHTPEGTQNLAWQLFRGYDGAGGRFGEEYLSTKSSHADLAIHAAKRSDGATTIVVINKNLGGACEWRLDAAALKGKLRVWRFDQKSNRVQEAASEATTIVGGIKATLPPGSASMFVVK